MVFIISSWHTSKCVSVVPPLILLGCAILTTLLQIRKVMQT